MNDENFDAQKDGAKIEDIKQVDSAGGVKPGDLLAMILASVLILVLMGGSFLLATLTKASGPEKKEDEVVESQPADDEDSTSHWSEDYDDDEDVWLDEWEDDEDDEDDEQNEEDDVAREEDVKKVLIAIVEYQADNAGKTPLSSENGLASFVRLYIDSKCSDGKKNDSATLYTYGGTCGENFQDPDGTEYKIRVGEISKQLSVGGIWKGPYFDGTVTHELIMVGGAKCADKEAYVEKASGDRFLAVLYAGDDSIICMDNS